jgi:CheY-like chemotaxis protein
MNTTSRIETTGKAGKIQLSSETADLLIKGGKNHWLVPREEKVHAKGKGEMSTYWLIHTKKISRRSSLCSLTSQNSFESNQSLSNQTIPAKHLRLVDWIAAELAALLKDIERSRKARGVIQTDPYILASLEQETILNPRLPRDQIVEVVALPEFQKDSRTVALEDVELDDQVLGELHDYILAIAQAYPLSNPFHNFEHASHVTMSCCKLFSRIVPRDDAGELDEQSVYELHQKTHGISSDPLSRFSVVLSALIHDVGHPGVPNMILFQENHPLTERYNSSPAEQNSVDFSWQLLQQERFSYLRSSIYTTQEEFQRFRQILINVVMSTDIMDPALAAEREARWERAYVQGDERLRGTITLEHILQASDVSHTMQHWHVYRKWNGRLLEEMNQAYRQGRTVNSPSNRWYEGEMSFFDGHILPLAEKLNHSGVFGVLGQEYLTYAMMNKKEWTLFGQGIVSGIVDTIKHNGRFPIPAPRSPPRLVGNFLSPSGPSRRRSLKERFGSSVSSIASMKAPTLDAAENRFPETLSVLVVDDDKILRKLFVRSVQRIAPQWTISEASSGEEAVTVVSDQGNSAYDLIFMDHYMGTDESKLLGSDAVYQLRKQGVRDTIICGMSANDVESMFLDAGADAFCFKPWRFQTQSMKSELERVLGIIDDGDAFGGSESELLRALHSP